MRLRRLFGTFAVGLGAVLAPSGAPLAAAVDVPQAGGANNIVNVATTGSAMTLARASTQVATVAGPTVGSTNIANASATNCTGCHSTAVAVQTIFVVGSPQYFVPGNAATAVNGGCSFCVSFAYAWQYVLQVSGPVHLTPAGQAQIVGLRQQISDTVESTVVSDLAGALALRAELDRLTSQLKSVIDGELVASGVLATGTPNEHVDTSNGDINVCPPPDPSSGDGCPAAP
jgi:hypothetical protein